MGRISTVQGRPATSAVNVQLLQPSQAAQARWDGAAELVVVEYAESANGTPQHCAGRICSAVNAQLLQPSQAAKAEWDAATELVVIEKSKSATP